MKNLLSIYIALLMILNIFSGYNWVNFEYAFVLTLIIGIPTLVRWGYVIFGFAFGGFLYLLGYEIDFQALLEDSKY